MWRYLQKVVLHMHLILQLWGGITSIVSELLSWNFLSYTDRKVLQPNFKAIVKRRVELQTYKWITKWRNPYHLRHSISSSSVHISYWTFGKFCFWKPFTTWHFSMAWYSVVFWFITYIKLIILLCLDISRRIHFQPGESCSFKLVLYNIWWLSGGHTCMETYGIWTLSCSGAEIVLNF